MLSILPCIREFLSLVFSSSDNFSWEICRYSITVPKKASNYYISRLFNLSPSPLTLREHIFKSMGEKRKKILYVGKTMQLKRTKVIVVITTNGDVCGFRQTKYMQKK